MCNLKYFVGVLAETPMCNFNYFYCDCLSSYYTALKNTGLLSTHYVDCYKEKIQKSENKNVANGQNKTVALLNTSLKTHSKFGQNTDYL